MSASPAAYVLLCVLLVLNWPVYRLISSRIFPGGKDLKRSLWVAFKGPLFWDWKTEEPWIAGKAASLFFICGAIVWLEFAVLIEVLVKVIA